MALKALKNSNGNICIDGNGNIILVNASDPGPGPTPVGGDVTKTYVGKALTGPFDYNTWSAINWSSYDDTSNIMAAIPPSYNQEFEVLLNGNITYTGSYALGINAYSYTWTNYGYYLTEINNVTNYSGLLALYDGYTIAFTDILRGMGSSLELTFDRAVDLTGLGDQLFQWKAGDDCMFALYTIAANGNWANITTDSDVYKFYSDLGLDIIEVISRFNNKGWDYASLRNYMTFDTLRINAPAVRYISDMGQTQFSSIATNMVLSFKDLQSVGDQGFYGVTSVYINNGVTMPEFASQFFGSAQVGGDLYVPQNMVTLYTNSPQNNANHIYAYDFDNNQVIS